MLEHKLRQDESVIILMTAYIVYVGMENNRARRLIPIEDSMHAHSFYMIFKVTWIILLLGSETLSTVIIIGIEIPVV
jgi:hypothetical protein